MCGERGQTRIRSGLLLKLLVRSGQPGEPTAKKEKVTHGRWRSDCNCSFSRRNDAGRCASVCPGNALQLMRRGSEARWCPLRAFSLRNEAGPNERVGTWAYGPNQTADAQPNVHSPAAAKTSISCAGKGGLACIPRACLCLAQVRNAWRCNCATGIVVVGGVPCLLSTIAVAHALAQLARSPSTGRAGSC
jgi:hypothetical protein